MEAIEGTNYIRVIHSCPKCQAPIRENCTSKFCFVFQCGHILYADGTYMESIDCVKNQRDILVSKIMHVLPGVFMLLESEFSKDSVDEEEIKAPVLDEEELKELHLDTMDVEKVVAQILGVNTGAFSVMLN